MAKIVEVRNSTAEFLTFVAENEEYIIWATNDYAERGEGYTFYDQITTERICSNDSRVIVPRVLKDKGSQKNRARKMAEVFTPSWLCNQMLNDVDERLFGRMCSIHAQKWVRFGNQQMHRYLEMTIH